MNRKDPDPATLFECFLLAFVLVVGVPAFLISPFIQLLLFFLELL